MYKDENPDGDSVSKQLTENLLPLKIFAFRLTGDVSRAADLLQETTVKVLLKSDSFDYNSNFGGWASTIMHHIYLNERHRSSRCISVCSDSLFDGEYSDSYVDLKDIVRAIDTLPVEYRSVFSLYADGYKYYEISERLNIPIGTVKSRIHTARTRLQMLLKDYIE